MMHFLRGRVAKIIFGVLLVAFLGWIVAELGMYGRIGSPRSEIATVNGEAISSQEFSMLYNQEMDVSWRNLRSSLTEADELQLRREILDRLIDQTLLWQEAKRLDCAVSTEIAQASIRAMPTFRNAQGVFDPVRYQAVLSRLGIPSQVFELQQERALSVARLESFLQEGVRCTDLELWLEYLRWHRRMQGELLVFPLEEARRGIEITEDQVREYWAQNRQLYERPERARIRHIWISARPEGGPDAAAQAQAQAQSILEEVKAGGDFAEIARAKSNDSNTAVRGGDLGWHSRGNLIPEYESVVFKLRDGEVSDLVQVPQGFSIIKCDRYEKEQKPAYEDIRRRIRKELRDARARAEMGQEAYRAGWYLAKEQGEDFESVGERVGRKPRKTGWFEWGKTPPLGLSVEVFDQLMEHIAGLEPGETSQVVEAGDGFYIFKLTEERHLRAPQTAFLQEREIIEPVMLRRKRRTALTAWLGSIRKRAKIKTSL